MDRRIGAQNEDWYAAAREVKVKPRKGDFWLSASCGAKRSEKNGAYQSPLDLAKRWSWVTAAGTIPME